MDFLLTEAEEAFRREIHDFLREELTEEVLKEAGSGLGIGPHSRQFLSKVGAKGWLAPALPQGLGGIGASHFQRLILAEEMQYHEAPAGGSGPSIVAPTLMFFGSEEQKEEYIPRIARGEIMFALGYTEPDAGSDLASLEMRAVKDGDDYVISGQKRFNSECHYAEYHWLAARTNLEVPRHKGISLFMVELKSPGITISPIWTMGRLRTNEVFYDGVRVPKRNLVGQENRGWYQVATALDLERIMPVGGAKRLFDDLVEYAKETKRNGRSLGKDPLVRHRLAEMAVEIDVARMFAYRVAWLQNKGIVPNYETAILKAFNSELRQRLAATGIQIMGLYGQLQEGSKWALLRGKMELEYRASVVMTIGGGTSEIMRNVIALRGLGLPR